MPDKLYTSALVLCEGKYDKQRLETVLDAVILTTDGFRIFKNPHLRHYLTVAAEEHGLIIVTDSDRAGQQIRQYVTSFVNKQRIAQVYVPRIAGCEKRKAQPSREGILGVEGIDAATLREVLLRAGIGEEKKAGSLLISKQDLYDFGLSGTADAAANRKALCERLQLPPYLTANALLDALNVLMSRETFLKMSDHKA